MTMVAAFSPINSAVLYVFAPTFRGQIERSNINTYINSPAHLRFSNSVSHRHSNIGQLPPLRF